MFYISCYVFKNNKKKQSTWNILIKTNKTLNKYISNKKKCRQILLYLCFLVILQCLCWVWLQSLPQACPPQGWCSRLSNPSGILQGMILLCCARNTGISLVHTTFKALRGFDWKKKDGPNVGVESRKRQILL